MNVSAITADRLHHLRLVGITDSSVLPWPLMDGAIGRALDAGLPALMFRENTMEPDQLASWGRALRLRTRERGALLIINRWLDLARAVRADGIHLGEGGPTVDEARRALGPDALVGYSAHAPDEALAAFAAGADYVTLSPIYATESKPGTNPLGLTPLSVLTRKTPGPVIALGGIGPAQVSSVMNVGAHGVGVIRAIFAAKDPDRATRHLLAMIEGHNLEGQPR
ncbi:MAG: thiamine phosphate synthase [bacterium]|nr:thiamine phosphate synthase [bacterium]